MTEILAAAFVVLTGLYFLGLATASFLTPGSATRFLLGFAGSARKHYTELLLRFVVGFSLVHYATQMHFTWAFSLFGWVLIATTGLLFLVPWRWHHRFAQQVVPPVTRHIKLLGAASLVLGGVILYAVSRAGSA